MCVLLVRCGMIGSLVLQRIYCISKIEKRGAGRWCYKLATAVLLSTADWEIMRDRPRDSQRRR